MPDMWLFVNRFASDNNYSLRNCQKLAQPIPIQLSKEEEKNFQMQLTKKEKIFSQFFVAFLKFISILNILIERYSS